MSSHVTAPGEIGENYGEYQHNNGDPLHGGDGPLEEDPVCERCVQDPQLDQDIPDGRGAIPQAQQVDIVVDGIEDGRDGIPLGDLHIQSATV